MTPQPPAQPATAWSPPQLIRLESEWRRLQRSFACHPFIQVMPLNGEPPGEYQVQYKVRTLAFNPQNQLTYVTSCPIHIWLPPQFPHAPPAVRPMAPIFHPNVTMEWIYLPVPWNASLTLTQVVTIVGQLLAYQTWDPNQNASPVAMDWLVENQHLCPTDPVANFNLDAEGDPLSRIARSGSEAIEQIRTRLKKMCDRLLLVPPPGAPEVRRFATQARLQLSLFTEADAPEALRTQANELDEVAQSMLAPHSIWDALGQEFAAINNSALAAENAAQAVDSMREAQQALAQLAPPQLNRQDAVKSLASLPPLTSMQPLLLTLRRATRDAEQKLAALRNVSVELERKASPLPEVTGTAGSMLHERLAVDIARARGAAAAVKARVAEVIDAAAPAVIEDKRELNIAERLVEWAEYADLLKRADALDARMVNLGPGGIQSFMLKVGSKLMGPFEYEQRLDEFGLRFAVSNLGTTAIDLLDTRAGTLVAHADSGQVTTSLIGKSGQPVAIVIQPAEHNEELRVQFEYLVTQSKEKFARLVAHGDLEPTPSWLGEQEAFLRSAGARAALTAENKARRQRWKGLLIDLAALGKFKLRLSTYFQLERVSELVPRVRTEIRKSEDRLEQTNRRLAEIAAKSGRDLETEQLVVPAKLVPEYTEKTAERDRAARDIPRFEKLLENAAGQVRLRLSAPRLTGAPGLPAFYVLPPLAEHWADFEAALSDAEMFARVEHLEGELGAKVRPDTKPLFGVTPAPSTAPRPAGSGAAPPPPPAGGPPVAMPVARPLPPGAVPMAGAAVAAVAASGVIPPAKAPASPVAPVEPDPEYVEQEFPAEAAESPDAYTQEDYAQQGDSNDGGEYIDMGQGHDAANDPFASIEDDGQQQEE